MCKKSKKEIIEEKINKKQFESAREGHNAISLAVIREEITSGKHTYLRHLLDKTYAE